MKSIFYFWFLAVVLFLITVTSFTSCYQATPIDPHTVFRYNEHRNITSLDPAFARNPQNIWPIQQVFNGLVQLNKNLTVVPEIANHWEIDSTGMIYRFHLKKDVYFHSSVHFGSSKTRAVTAADFVYSFERLRDPELSSPGGWVLQHVDQFSAVNPHLFEIRLKQPFPAFLGLLSMRYCSVVPKEVIQADPSGFRKKPIGTGPFRFQAWQEDVKLVLRKNNRYFEKDSLGNKLPYLEAVSIRFLADIQSEYMLFTLGEFDFLNSLDHSYKDDLLTPEGLLRKRHKEKIRMEKGPYLNTEYIGFYMESKNPALGSLEIREAINRGFDRKKMIHYLRNTIGAPSVGGIIPNSLAGQNQNLSFPYDPELASALVRSYVKNTGEKPVIRLATDINYVDLCEFMQRELEKIGITIEIDLMPTATLRQAKSSGQLEAFRASWIADYPDAENYLSLFYSDNFSPQGPNYTHFKNAHYDSLFRRALVSRDINKRNAIYQVLDSIVMSKFPIVPLYYDEAVRFVQKNVSGLEMNPLNVLQLKRVTKSAN